jgi:L-fuconolactonase
VLSTDQAHRQGTLFSRRSFLHAAAGLVLASGAGCQTVRRAPEILDCHTHFYDPTRPQGIPWPGKNDRQLYRRVLPADYKAVAASHGVTGTVVVEASPWLEDNQWILDLADREPFIRGFVGNVSPMRDDFADQIRRFAKHRRFRGIRVSFGDVGKLTAAANLQKFDTLVQHGLSLDLNGGTESLVAVALVARAHPKLPIIINHVANVRIDGKAPPAAWREALCRVAEHENVFCKLSGLVEGTGKRGAAPHHLEFYRPVLDHVWQCFGESRLVYGSNWPVSELFADFSTVHALARDFVAEKGDRAVRQVFAGNAQKFYRL